MSECEHVWWIRLESVEEYPYYWFECRDCGFQLSGKSVIERLNENAALKAEKNILLEFGTKQMNDIDTLKRGIEKAHLHLLVSVCECGQPLKETDAFDELDALLGADDEVNDNHSWNEYTERESTI